MRQFFSQIFQDYLGQFSSKRTVVFITWILLAIAFVANLFWGFMVDHVFWQGFLYIVLTGMGLTTIEPAANAVFRNKKSSDDDQDGK